MALLLLLLLLLLGLLRLWPHLLVGLDLGERDGNNVTLCVVGQRLDEGGLEIHSKAHCIHWGRHPVICFREGQENPPAHRPACRNNMYEPACRKSMYEPACRKNMHESACRNKMHESACRNNMYEPAGRNNMYELACKNNMYKSASRNKMHEPACRNKTYEPACRNKTCVMRRSSPCPFRVDHAAGSRASVGIQLWRTCRACG